MPSSAAVWANESLTRSSAAAPPASGASRARITNTRWGGRNRSSVLYRLLLSCVLVRGTLTPRHPSRENALASAPRGNGGGRPLGRRGLPPPCRASNGPLAAKAVVSERVPLVNEPTDPVGPPDAGGAPQRHDDITAGSTEPAVDEESRRSFSHRGRRAVLFSLACVAALLVGFGSVTVLLKLRDRPARSDTEPVPTTAAPVAPPSAAAPAVTTPPAPAPSGPAVENESTPAPPAPAPPAPAPPPRAEAAESPAPPSSSSPTTTVTTKTPNTTSPSPDPDGAPVTPRGPE